ncbi:hypothetical protein [Moraxella osloensis]|jgi:adenosyl cobinamide kinase/adenosyl cobinamide phosphate guanylyltransferase|uniref:Uncharacterized protein n=1 Tax=Faucicola osloensis TaxID=34062 RepID=A0A2D2LY36_FAUOS|nr:hypothetical protein [Moraxella osloensis]ATR79955.1 hypothetical protein NP7_11385 [Moraxella osloensis]MCK6053422.1 hypothetical protein [Moraxella osloensis]MCK6159312.1 hypothetical protein [Moraxella osloensis]
MTENQPKTKNIYQKTIAQLIKELQSFEDQSLIVMVTSNCGETFKPVELVSKGFEDDDNKVYCALHIDGEAE